MNGFRWIGGLAALAGAAASSFVLLLFIGLSKCPIGKILFSDSSSSCSGQRAVLIVFSLLLLLGLASIYAIARSKNERSKKLWSAAALLYGLFVVWVFFYGMAGSFGSGLH
jgi:hypothetical protein